MNSSKTPPNDTVGGFLALRRKVTTSDKLVIDIMSHPEATPEQIARARAICLNIRTQYKDIRKSLRELYPDPSLWRTYPWNDRGES
jgi:hypothetical protein